MNEHRIFSHRFYSILLGVIVCFFWGSLYSCIKSGYYFFEIDSKDIPSIMLFAGLRFLVSGGIMVVGVSAAERKYVFPFKNTVTVAAVLAVAFTTIVIHYSLSYTGISFITESGKSSILKQIGYLFISCFAFLFVKDDKFSIRKVIGGILGFVGIIVVNLGNDFSISIGVGEVLIILSSFFSVAGNIISKHFYDKVTPSYLVAHSQFTGGLILTVAALLMGGRIGRITPQGILIFTYICAASIISYLLWNQLIKYNDISKMSVIKYLEPVFGVLIGVVVLREEFKVMQYLAAFAAIVVAILVSNIGMRKSNK